MADLSLELSDDLVGTDAYRDLRLIAGDLVLTDDVNPLGTQSISQDLQQRLRFVAGEWFLNVTLGLPYYTELLGNRGRIGAFEALLQNTVLATPGVLSLLTWNTDYDRAGRRLTVQFQAQSATGVINYNSAIGPTTGSNA